MILPIQQPPVVSPTSAAVAAVNPIVTIQAISNASAIGEGSGGASPLAAIANGTTIEGFVVNRDAQSNPILRTAIGDLRVTSEVFLKTGSEVTIRVDNSLSSLARIISVDGLTPQDYSTQTQAARAGLTKDTISASGLQPLLNNAATPASNIGAPKAANPVLQAIILQGQPTAIAPSLLASALAASQSGPVQALAQLSQLRAGTPIRLTVLDITLPPLPIALNSVPPSAKLEAVLPPRVQSALPAAPNLANSPTQPIAATLPQPIAGIGSAPVPAINPNITDAESAPLQTMMQQRSTLNTAIATTKSIDPLLAPKVEARTSSSPPAPSTTAAAPNQISVSVIGHDADGANILHTPFATLKLYTPQPLPTGTTLLVSAQIETDTTLVAPVTLAEENLANSIPKGDQVIEDVLAWMLTNHPDAARALQQRLPTIDNKLTSGLLFLIAAMKGGNIDQLLGKRALRLLETDAPGLLSRLRQEIGQMQANLADSPLTHWTLYPLSMMLGHEMQHARLYVGKDPNEGSQQSTDTRRGQRFVLEVDLSQLGPMQFDGFVRANEGKKSFDLMVRSTAVLENAISQEIRSIFENSLAVTGLNGQIIFQHGGHHFVRPMADSKPRGGEGFSNTILA